MVVVVVVGEAAQPSLMPTARLVLARTSVEHADIIPLQLMFHGDKCPFDPFIFLDSRQ